MNTISLSDDMHVHSIFSDGKGTLLENITMAELRGLKRLGCVDHVRRATDWLPEYVKAIDKHRKMTDIELLCGIEAKILDEQGTIDVPEDLTGVDLVYVADHRFPLGDRCWTPRQIRQMLAAGDVTRERLIEALVSATSRAMFKHENIVIAHLFSILPKIGMEEKEVPTAALDALAFTAAKTGTIVEIDERWACPSARTLQAFVVEGVEIVLSSDSHQPETIGIFNHNLATVQALYANVL